MNIQERNIFSDGLLCVILVASILFPESDLHLAVLSIGLILSIAIRFKATPLSPFFFLAPAAGYLAINLIYVYVNSVSGYNYYFVCACLGLLAFSVSLRRNFNIRQNVYLNKISRSGLIVGLYFGSISYFVGLSILSSLDFSPLVLKAIRLSVNPVAFAIMIGSLVAISSRSLLKSILLSSGFLFFVIIQNRNAEDSSRIAYVDYFVIVLLCFFFGYSRLSNRLFQGVRWVALIAYFAMALIFASIAVTSSDLRLGGDVLIVDGGIKSIEMSRGVHQYLMPFFNGGLIMVPEQLWFVVKPKEYNISAWYITNVMGLSASSYPWGVGVSLFAASYVYGGYVGVVLIFYLLGFYVGVLSGLVRNSFWAGFFCCYLMRLPFSIFRMDETFIFGSVALSTLVLTLFFFVFRRGIDRCFRVRVRGGDANKRIANF